MHLVWKAVVIIYESFFMHFDREETISKKDKSITMV